MIRVAICDDDIVFTTRVEELILDFGRAYSFEICIYFDGYTLLESMRQGNCFDIIFMDPPYRQGLEEDVLRFLSKSDILKPDTKIIVEASLDTDFSYLDELGFNVLKFKKYKTNMHVFIQKR
mgnify:CR=1 FL=1